MNKNIEITFDQFDTFNRKRFSDNLMKIIKNSELLRDESFVIAIDSDWGTGKSIFLKQFENEFQNSKDILYDKNSTILVNYNAWENDDWNDAFVPLCYELFQRFSKDVKEMGLKEEVINNFKEISYQVGKNLLEGFLKTKGVTEDTISLFKRFLGQKAEVDKKSMEVDFFNDFQTHKDLLCKFRNVLTKITDSYGDNYKLIIIIDELDRCRPTFAIQTLEIIKHFFAVDNVIFILGIDIVQLRHSISTVYGQDMDSTGYLRRFIDVNLRLPLADITLYVQSLCKMPEKYSLIVEEAMYFYNASIRDIKKIINAINSFYLSEFSMESKNNIHYFRVYVFLICVKNFYPSEYKAILCENFWRSSNASQRDNVNKVSVENHIFPSDLWQKTISGLQNGGNNKILKDMINIDTKKLHHTDLNNIIDLDEVEKYDLYSLKIGQYIDSKIELLPFQN